MVGNSSAAPPYFYFYSPLTTTHSCNSCSKRKKIRFFLVISKKSSNFVAEIVKNSTIHIVIVLICCILTSIGRQSVCAATVQPPQFTFNSTSSLCQPQPFNAPSVAMPQRSSFRTTSSPFRGYGARHTHTVSLQQNTYRSTPSISANYHSYISASTAPTHQESQQRMHSYQGGASSIAISSGGSSQPTTYSAGTASIPSVSTGTLPYTTASRTDSDQTTKAGTPFSSAYLNTLKGHSAPEDAATSQPTTAQPVTHLYHTFSALHSSSTSSIPTPPTIQRVVGTDGTGAPDNTWTYNGNTYGRDNDGTLYIFFDGRWIKIANQNPGDIGWQYSPVGAPWILLLFLACYAFYKYRKQKQLKTNEI